MSSPEQPLNSGASGIRVGAPRNLEDRLTAELRASLGRYARREAILQIPRGTHTDSRSARFLREAGAASRMWFQTSTAQVGVREK
jgi:hypothetical protein